MRNSDLDEWQLLREGVLGRPDLGVALGTNAVPIAVDQVVAADCREEVLAFHDDQIREGSTDST